MWEVYRLPFRGNFSLRTLVALFTAAILTTLFGALLNSQPVFAAPEKAEWQDGKVIYDAKEYTPDSTPNIPGIPPGATVFSRKDETAGKVKVLYYEQGADTTKDIKIKVIEYTLNNDGTYSSPGPPTEHTLEAKTAADGKTTQCSIAGVGWIVCTLSRWIAGSMDKIFDIIAGYLEVHPITTQTDSALYKSWEIGRSIANLCFVLAFLLIIYAQITSQGLNNYEIKKMIPKLIIAAVLVNISYYICSIAVDVSNILGHGIQQIFVDIRKSLPISNTNFEAVTWKNFTEYIMSGGAVAAAGIIGIKAAADAGGIGALALMQAPILVGALIAVLIAVLILAARQALIVVLIVVSPLAFVAMLLPNTEKWFEKWKDLLTTMLLVFPLFSLLFGGSQLASHIIMQSADQFSVLLLALFVQAAPLALTPFLIKFSGSLLGRFAGMMNDPQKGLVDRTRNWAKENNDVRRAKRMEEMARSGGKKGTRLQRMGYKREMDRRDRKAWVDTGEKWTQAGWENDARSHAHHMASAQAGLIEKVGESHSEAAIESAKLTNPTMRRAVAQIELNEATAKNHEAKLKAALEEAKAGEGSVFGAAYAAQAAAQAEQAQATAYRTGTAQAYQKINYAKAILANDALAMEAGGMDTEGGADSARASAVAALKKSQDESINEGRVLASQFNLSAADRQNIAKGITVTGTDDNGNVRQFTASDSPYVQMAAIKDQIARGTVEEAQDLITLSSKQGPLYEHRKIIQEAMIEGGLGQKAAYLGGKTNDLVLKGEFDGKEMLRAALEATAKGKLSAEVLLNQDRTAMETIVNAVKQGVSGQIHLESGEAQALPHELEKLFGSASRAINDTRINARLGERAGAMEALAGMGYDGTPYTNPMPRPSGPTHGPRPQSPSN